MSEVDDQVRAQAVENLIRSARTTAGLGRYSVLALAALVAGSVLIGYGAVAASWPLTVPGAVLALLGAGWAGYLWGSVHGSLRVATVAVDQLIVSYGKYTPGSASMLLALLRPGPPDRST